MVTRLSLVSLLSLAHCSPVTNTLEALSSNLVNTQSAGDIQDRRHDQYLAESGQEALSSHFPDNSHKQSLSGDKGEDRVDLRPLRDFLAALPGDPTGIVANAAAETWNWMPPLQNIEIRKNFNKLKSGFDAMHFMSRDTVVWLGGSLMWVALHFLLWDGRVNTQQDLDASLRSPGVKVQLPSHADLASGVISPDTSDDTKGNTFLETPDPLRFWNGLADPDASTRRLYTNVLYGLMSQILWILPTFIGKIPDPDERQDSENLIPDSLDHLDAAEDRITTLTDNLATAPIQKNWNRLMKLQGVFANIGINFLNYFGRWMFWLLATRPA